jgi:hypothetical protein
MGQPRSAASRSGQTTGAPWRPPDARPRGRPDVPGSDSSWIPAPRLVLAPERINAVLRCGDCRTELRISLQHADEEVRPILDSKRLKRRYAMKSLGIIGRNKRDCVSMALPARQPFDPPRHRRWKRWDEAFGGGSSRQRRAWKQLVDRRGDTVAHAPIGPTCGLRGATRGARRARRAVRTSCRGLRTSTTHESRHQSRH